MMIFFDLFNNNYFLIEILYFYRFQFLFAFKFMIAIFQIYFTQHFKYIIIIDTKNKKNIL